MVCPFFGDQFFWGEVCLSAGVGAPPVSALQLDAEVRLTSRRKFFGTSSIEQLDQLQPTD